jgi:hypothetical protein
MTRIHVTDHALVRYMERVLHIDMEKVREDLRAIAENTVPMSAPPRDAHMHVGGKCVCIIESNTVVTVLGTREIKKGRTTWWAQTQEAAE